MNKILNDDLIYLVLSIVEEIPEGNVATYGQIARLAGKPKNSRLIGKILSMSEFYGKYPCHRVVGTNKSLTGYGGGINNKLKLLELEGIDINKYYVPTKGTAL